MTTRRFSFSIDFDTLARDLFRPQIPHDVFRKLEDVSFHRVLPRILAFLDAQGIRATFFVIGRHVRDYAEPIAQIAARGHEIANHSFNHRRNFASLDRAEIQREIREAHEALSLVAGVAPVGFRAPGYTITSNVIAALTDLEYAYDASLVPSWFYSTTKHLYRLFAGLDYREYLHPQSVRCAGAPKLPYPIDPSRLFVASASARLMEIPQTTVGVLQFPLIYGLVARVAPSIRDRFERRAVDQPVITMGLHDLEFASAEDIEGLPVGELTRPHVARPVAERLAELGAMCERLTRNHVSSTLSQVSAAHSRVAAAHPAPAVSQG